MHKIIIGELSSPITRVDNFLTSFSMLEGDHCFLNKAKQCTKLFHNCMMSLGRPLSLGFQVQSKSINLSSQWMGDYVDHYCRMPGIKQCGKFIVFALSSASSACFIIQYSLSDTIFDWIPTFVRGQVKPFLYRHSLSVVESSDFKTRLPH